MPAGDHVRFWQVLDKGTDGRPVWLGSVTFDRGVSLSHDTGQVTHHIAPDIDLATLVVDGVRQTEPPVTLPPPTLVALKDQVWHGISRAISQ